MRGFFRLRTEGASMSGRRDLGGERLGIERRIREEVEIDRLAMPEPKHQYGHAVEREMVVGRVEIRP